VTAALSGSHPLCACIPSLLLGTVKCLGQLALHPPENVLPTQLAVATEITKTFSVLITGSLEGQRRRLSPFEMVSLLILVTIDTILLCILLPALSLLLSQDHGTPHSMHTLAISQVLSFAANNAEPFREAISKLDSSTQTILEASIRSALGRQGSSSVQASAKPQISLRVF
jgi:hypothetical protein